MRLEMAMPFDPLTQWTDQAVTGLIGQTPNIAFPDGSKRPSKVVGARKDEEGRVYITVEAQEL